MQLALSKQKKVENDSIEFSMQLQNRDGVKTPSEKSLYVYFFVSDYFNFSNFDSSNGDYFSTTLTSTQLSSFGVNGTLYEVELFPDSTFNSVFDKYENEYNSTNSVNLSFVFSQNPFAYNNSNVYYAGFDPILNKERR